MIKKLNNSQWTLIFLLSSVLSVYFFHLSEKVVLYTIIGYFSCNVVVNPKYGINFLILIMPFCLGNSKRPYFVYLEFFIYLIISSYVINSLFKKNFQFKRFPFKFFILFFLAVSCLSLPLNLKELYYYLKGTPFLNIFNSFLSSNEGYDIFYLRSWSNLFSAVAIFIITFSTMEFEDLYNLFKSMMIILLITCISGFAIRYNLIESQNPFLTLQLIGKYGIEPGKSSLCAFAYNAGYLGQYLICVIPLAGYILYRRDKIFFYLSCLALILSIIIIPLTFQRGPVIALFMEMFVFIIYLLLYSKNRKKLMFFSSLFFIVILSVFLILDKFLNHGFIITKFVHILSRVSLRDQIWKVAIYMFKDNLLLGVGLGKFHYFFPKYCLLADVAWSGSIKYVRSTAHNLYLHILAEQGIIGFFSFILLLGVIIKESILSLKEMTIEKRHLTVSLLIIINGMMFFGISQYIFYIRIIQIYFWCVLGFLVVLIKPYFKDYDISIKIFLLTVISLISLLGYRLYVIKTYLVV